MKNIVYPKCPYCHKELNKNGFNSPLQGLYGQFCSDTVEIKCEYCHEKYFVSKQTRFISRKAR